MVNKKYQILLVMIGVFASTVLFMWFAFQYRPAATVVNYPEKAITVLVPFVAGGSADLLTRSMEKLAVEKMGHPFVVNNMPGGSGTLAWNELAGAKKDGYVVGLVTSNIFLQPLYGATRFHYPTALEPLAQIATSSVVVVVRSDDRWSNLLEIINYAKERPGEIKCGNAGLGTVNHVVGEMFGQQAGIKITQVPFRGDSEALAALLGGHVQIAIIFPSSIKEHVKAGKVRLLAVASPQRLSDQVFQEVPTFEELGINVVFVNFWGIAAPKMLPKEVKEELAAGLKDIINDPEYKRNLAAMGLTVDYLGPDDFKNKWIRENDRLFKIVKESGIAELVKNQKN